MGAQVGARLASAVWFPALVRTASGTHADVLEGSLIRHLLGLALACCERSVCVLRGTCAGAQGDLCLLLFLASPVRTASDARGTPCHALPHTLAPVVFLRRGEAGQVPPQQSVLPRSYVCCWSELVVSCGRAGRQVPAEFALV